jgi:hypothetical protein
MPASRLFTRPTTRWERVGRLVALCALVCALTPASADAVHIDLVMPDTVTVGQAGLIANVTLTNSDLNLSSVCNVGECTPPSEGIIVIPSCGAATVAPPACGSADPRVFSFAPIGKLHYGQECPSTSPFMGFDVVVADAAQGKLRVKPQDGGRVMLVNDLFTTCSFDLTFAVSHLPTIDVAPTVPGIQTYASASAQSTDANPFGTARRIVTVLPAAMPPATVPPPPPAPVDVDHFKCYESTQPNVRQRSVSLRDEFGQRRSRLLRTRQLCNPVSKNQGKLLHPRAHLVCYQTRDQNPRFVRRTVLVSNQFGQRKLTVLRPNRLCVPSLKRKTAGALPSKPDPARLVDHFRCYDVTAGPATETVTLVDQFRTSKTQVLQVKQLCNPVRKNNEPVRRAASHLVCYSIRDDKAFNPLAVRVRNQFGRAALRVRRPQTLCLPSFTKVIS